MNIQIPSLESLLPYMTILLCSITLMRAIRFRKRNSEQACLIKEMDNTLLEVQENLHSLQMKQKKEAIFQSSLKEAEITTRLQQPRMNIQHSNRSCSAPERYSYIHSLTRKGMQADEIASLLTISLFEAKQLVTLARIAVPRQENAADEYTLTSTGS